jgi:hypothetical protein
MIQRLTFSDRITRYITFASEEHRHKVQDTERSPLVNRTHEYTLANHRYGRNTQSKMTLKQHLFCATFIPCQGIWLSLSTLPVYSID